MITPIQNSSLLVEFGPYKIPETAKNLIFFYLNFFSLLTCRLVSQNFNQNIDSLKNVDSLKDRKFERINIKLIKDFLFLKSKFTCLQSLNDKENFLLDEVIAQYPRYLDKLVLKKIHDLPHNFISKIVCVAAAKGREDLLKEIKRQCQDINFNKKVRFFKSKSVQILSSTETTDNTALHLAVFNGHLETVKFLVTYLNSVDSYNGSLNDYDLQRMNNDSSTRDVHIYETPLHIAVARGFEDITQFLVDSDADVNLQDHDGNTPLHLAAALGAKKIATILLRAGASTKTRNNKDQTPEQLAKEKQHTEMVKLLKNRFGSCKKVLQSLKWLHG